MITADDVRHHVIMSLGHRVREFDVNAIVLALIAGYHVTGDLPAMQLEDIEPEEYWAIVAHHAIR